MEVQPSNRFDLKAEQLRKLPRIQYWVCHASPSRSTHCSRDKPCWGLVLTRGHHRAVTSFSAASQSLSCWLRKHLDQEDETTISIIMTTKSAFARKICLSVRQKERWQTNPSCVDSDMNLQFLGQLSAFRILRTIWFRLAWFQPSYQALFPSIGTHLEVVCLNSLNYGI